MADRPSTRIATRRKTPQNTNLPRSSHSPPRGTTRVTRSQSRDISDNGADPVDGGRRRVKPKKPKAIHNEQSSVTGRQIKYKNEPSRSAKPLPDLTEINEGSDIQYPALPRNSHEEGDGAIKKPDAARRDSGQTLKSTGRVSGFSGTTVRTSGSGQELSREIVEDMIYNLDDLSDASDKILRQLLLPDSPSETSFLDRMARFSDSKARETKQLDRYSSTFQEYRNIYGDALFVDVPTTVRNTIGLPKQEILQPRPWRPDTVFYKANLTTFVKILASQINDNVDGTFEAIDRDFPRPFVQQFVDKTRLNDTADGSALLRETFDLALEIRTRSFIESAKRLIDVPKFDPDSFLQQIFLKDDKNFNGWDVSGMRSQDILKTPELGDTIIARLYLLRQTFSETESPYIDLDILDRDFPVSPLLARLGQWSQLRLDEIEYQMKRLKGAKGIADAVQSALNRGNGSPVGPQTDQVQLHENAGSGASGIAPSLNSPQVFRPNIARLKAWEKRRASKNQEQLPSQAAAAVKATPTPAVAAPKILPPASAPAQVQTKDVPSSREPPPWQAPDIESGEEHTDQPDNLTLVEKIMQTQETLNAESNKENVAVPIGSEPAPSSQLDLRREASKQKKPFPKRIAFDSQESEQADVRESPSDISEDEGFQTDTRRVASSKSLNTARRNDTDSANGRSPPKRARTGRERRVAVEGDNIADFVQRHNAVNAPPPASQAEIYQLANSKAKERVALRPKRTQTRKPWSVEEIDRLLELIEEHGLSWSLLKKLDHAHRDGPLLQERDQVALKDKARNIKLDYLK
ncbi:MAG: hypothetical protein Q9215_000197 [Flavoplaca cf. flavocitrina]